MKSIVLTLRRLMPLLPAGARRFLWIFAIVTVSLSLVDALALGLLAVALSGIVGGGELSLPGIGRLAAGQEVVVLLIVGGVIVLKALVTMLFQWVATRRFAVYELEIGDRLFRAYIHAPWTERIKKNSSQLVRLADVGIANTISGFLFPLMNLPSYLVTAGGVVIVILIADPVTALVTFVYLGGIAALLTWVIGHRAVQAGRVARDYAFKVAALMTDMVMALKEITLRGKADEVARVVDVNREHITRARANIRFLSSVPRFVIDAALVGGFLIVGGVAYLVGGLQGALSSVALFGVAGFRLVPSLTGTQSTIASVQSSLPQVDMVIEDIEQATEFARTTEETGTHELDREPRALELRGVGFTHEASERPAVRDIDLTIPIGSTVAFVGSSGAGKSTLVDIILGLLTPDEGEIMLDDRPLSEVLGAWRRRVGYVPQDVMLFDGTIAQNVALAWDDEIDVERVTRALARAQLLDVVESRPQGIGAAVGERGLRLSGGQRQRLGIARALYSDPLVLVLDEATSALDTRTEADVLDAVRELKGEVTIVSVAHRLSTIRDNDIVCFMSEGELRAHGTFDELVAQVPEFAAQAALAGLTASPARGDADRP